MGFCNLVWHVDIDESKRGHVDKNVTPNLSMEVWNMAKPYFYSSQLCELVNKNYIKLQ